VLDPPPSWHDNSLQIAVIPFAMSDKDIRRCAAGYLPMSIYLPRTLSCSNASLLRLFRNTIRT